MPIRHKNNFWREFSGFRAITDNQNKGGDGCWGVPLWDIMGIYSISCSKKR